MERLTGWVTLSMISTGFCNADIIRNLAVFSLPFIDFTAAGVRFGAVIYICNSQKG